MWMTRPPVFDHHAWQGLRDGNRWENLLILTCMGGLLFLTGWLIFGPDAALWIGLGGVLLLVLGSNLSPGLALRLHGARPLAAHQSPELHGVVERLARKAGLATVPGLYRIPSRAPNAFAVGEEGNAAIAVTDGLLETMTLREMAGVLAHEVSHVMNGDVRAMALADNVRRLTHATSILGQLILLFSLPLILSGALEIHWIWLGLLVLAPSLSALMQLALSRNREFRADLDAAQLTGDPEGLASALNKLERQARGWGRLFGYAREPAEMLRSHPKSEERIERLLSLVKTVPGWRWETQPRLAHRVVYPGLFNRVW